MHIQYYILPIEIYIQPDSGREYRGPKYISWRWGSGIQVQWSMKDYGRENTAVVAVNGEQSDHDFLSGFIDVYQFPENLDVNLSPANISAISTFLEAVFIPADWITPSDTFETALRTILGMFMSMQRYHGITGESFLDSGIAMNDQFRTWPPIAQTVFTDIWTHFGGDETDIKTNWTVRILLKNLADLWGTTPVHFGFITL